jgi:hypothetical protein
MTSAEGLSNNNRDFEKLSQFFAILIKIDQRMKRREVTEHDQQSDIVSKANEVSVETLLHRQNKRSR